MLSGDVLVADVDASLARSGLTGGAAEEMASSWSQPEAFAIKQVGLTADVREEPHLEK